ncbi:MAG: LysR family transcriptional regulator [Thiobacillaceae bacterium]
MLHISLRQLRVFETVARLLSYSKAARELHLTQPAVSMQVRSLEEGIGLPLTEQLGKRIFLTEAGREVFHYSHNIAALLNDMEAVLAGLKGLEHGNLKIAVASTANYYATQLLTRFRAIHPTITINLDVTNRQSIIAQLVANQIDLAIMGLPPEGLDLQTESFMENPLVMIAPPTHRLAGNKIIPLSDLAQESFVVREEGSGTRGAMERFFREHGLSPRLELVMSTNEAIKEAVQAGMGLAVVSRHTVLLELETGRLVVLPVEHLPIIRHWYVVQREGKHLSAVAQAFKEFLLTNPLPPEGLRTTPSLSH